MFEPVFFSHFLVIDWNVFEMTEKKLSHFSQNVWKYRLKNTFMARFNTTETNGQNDWHVLVKKKTQSMSINDGKRGMTEKF